VGVVALAYSFAFANPPQFPPEPSLDITVPAFNFKTLSCGIKVLYLHDDRLPIASGSLRIPGGNVTDPSGKEGLSTLTAAALREGGAGKLKPAAFDAALENKSISMGCSSEQEDYNATFQCLAEDLPEALRLFGDMLRRPTFDAKRLETEKLDQAEGTQRIEDTPDAITRALFTKSLFGHSAYGRQGSPAVVRKLTSGDVRNFYKDHYGPKGAVLVITGKFDEAAVSADLEKIFSGWKAQKPAPAYADAQPLGPTIYFFPKNVTQVFIRMGLPGLKRHDPRDVPLQVANYVLGGSGFTSRLMREIRSNRGLAYFVDSYFLPYNITGPFQVVGGTRPDSVKEYLTVMFDQLALYAKEGPTDAEMASAQKGMIAEYAYNFESSFTLAGYEGSLAFNGYPDDYLVTYRDKIKAVTREEAAQAVRDILSQKNWVLAVCGPDGLQKDLEGFGKVVTVKSVFTPLP
jgi:zinc protease